MKRIELGPAIIFLGGAVLMAALGCWQLQRLEWKTQLIRQIEEANRADPLTVLPVETDLPAREHYKVRFNGVFDAKEIHVTPRYHQGKLGYHIVQPFRLDEQTPTGKRSKILHRVLVDRGWVPANKKELELRPETVAPQHTVTIEGLLSSVGKKNWVTPDNDPRRNLWFWYDIPAIDEALGSAVMPTVIRQTNRLNDEILPVPDSEGVQLRNDHLGYAITWFSIALAAIVIFFVYHLDKNGREKTTA